MSMRFSLWRWFSGNLGSLLLALILAIAVWVSAVVVADPDVERVYPDPIPIQYIGQNSSLLLADDVPQQVEISLRAPSSVWDQLLADSGKLEVIADLSELGAGTHVVPLQVKIDARPVRVTSLNPEEVIVPLEYQISKGFTVQLVISGEPALGYQASASPVLEPRRVFITGPETRVAEVEKVIAKLDIQGARQTVETTLPLTVLDAQGSEITDLVPSPSSVYLTLPVTQLGGFRDVAVKVQIIGQVANGYRLTNLTVSPPVVTVFSADPAKVTELPGFVETEALDLTGAMDDLDKRLTLNLPEGVSIVGDSSVLVQVSIAAIEGSLTVSLPVEFVGLIPGFSATASPPGVDVILSGPLPVLDTITSADVRVFVDLTDLGEGTYQLVPQVDILPERVTLETVLPSTLEVTLVVSSTPTPTTTPIGGETPTPVP
jgi:YbbR domain-containing protein